MLRRLVLIVLVALLATPLAACGRRGPLKPPEGTTYPRIYPGDYSKTEPKPDSQ